MKAYIYQAALLCEDCAKAIMHDCAPVEGHLTDDSDYYPQGPYGNGGGEADTPQHCDHCHAFLENPLTDDGREYVRERIAEVGDRMANEIITEWSEFYDIPLHV